VTSDVVLALSTKRHFRPRLRSRKRNGDSTLHLPSDHLFHSDIFEKHLCRPAQHSHPQHRSSSTPALAEELFGSLQTHPRCSSHSTFAFAPHRRTTLSPSRARNPAQSVPHFPATPAPVWSRPSSAGIDEVLGLTVPLRTQFLGLWATSARLTGLFLGHMDHGYGVNTHRQIGCTAIR
jgi:hypothetical protein